MRGCGAPTALGFDFGSQPLRAGLSCGAPLALGMDEGVDGVGFARNPRRWHKASATHYRRTQEPGTQEAGSGTCPLARFIVPLRRGKKPRK